MTDLDQPDVPVDGRVARRERNVEAVIDVVLEMFAEDAMFPTIEQAAKRSGLSLRSVYRYFADPGELLEATIRHSNKRGLELSRLQAIGQGSLAARIDDFVAMRLRVHEGLGAVMRATAVNAARLPRIRDEYAAKRSAMLEQFELQFAPELDKCSPVERQAITAAGDVMTQISSIDYLRRDRGLSEKDTRAVLTTSLHTLLG